MGALPRLNDRVLLDDSLRPFWMLLRFSGLHPSWCGQHQRNWFSSSVRFIVSFLAVLLVSTNCLSQIYSLYSSVNLFEDNRLTTLYGTCLMSSGLYFMSIYMRYRDEFLQFYSEWREIETNFSNDSSVAKKRRINKLLYIYFFGKVLGYSFTTYFLDVQKPDPSFYFIVDPSSSEATLVHLYAFIKAITKYFCRIYVILGEVVPTLFFYQVGCVVEEIQRELQETFFSREMSSNDSAIAIDNVIISNSHVRLRNMNTFRRVWKKYETVYGFVNRGNHLFGSSIFCIDVSTFLLMCSGLYHALQDVPIAEKLVFSVTRLIEVLQFILMNRLMSHPALAKEELKTSLAALLSQKWQLLCEDDRRLLVAFQARLDNGKLAASPFNLYNVKPSNILSMLSLIVTYMIVLIQFN